MNAAAFAKRLLASHRSDDRIAHVERIPARQPAFSQTAAPIHADLLEALNRQGVDRLYTHQARAVDAARAGRHIVVATPTASGKTLCYNIPAIEAVLRDPRARALYLFPTKALAQDQLGKLNNLGLFPRVCFATYDGDTPRDERAAIRRGAHIVLTNPDMLHVGILPHHSGWAAFFRRLRYVIIDEIHTYRGIFGAHTAQILRRLLRVCAFYGARPQVIACSATIANPGELFQRLTGLEAQVAAEDGSPAGPRTFIFWNPPILAERGERRSSNVEAAALFSALVTEGVRTLAFARSRKSAELILRYARAALNERGVPASDCIRSYRAGYAPEERREIERRLFQGALTGVVATNAMELGVDVGGLDATVLTGYPGTIASTWQQAGRAGRGREESLSILVALDGPLDQFLMRHPEYFFGRPHEHAIVDPGNVRILAAHLECAAHELPLEAADLQLFDPAAPGVVEELARQDRFIERGGRWLYHGADHPAGRVNIRSASARSFNIRLADGRLLGTVEESRVYQTVHPGAIYLHQGENYLVEELREEEREAIVRPGEGRYHTEPRELITTSVIQERCVSMLGACLAHFGQVSVSTQVLGYRVKLDVTEEVLQVKDLLLPEQQFETEAFWLAIPASIILRLADARCDVDGAIHAAEHALIAMMPLHSMCDRWDLGGVSARYHPNTGGAAIFIYDAYPGGAGITRETFTRLRELLEVTQEMIEGCPCPEGCPSCVQSPKCGNNNEPLDKRGAAILLRTILENEPTCGESADAHLATP